MATRLAKNSPNFRIGTKNIYMPSHTISLIHRDNQPPDWATFQVPLRFTKFDLRDYLWHLYGVEVTGVRSWVYRKSTPIRSQRDKHWKIRSAEKCMTVTLVKPFVQPQTPTDLDPWDKNMFDLREKYTDKVMAKSWLRMKKNQFQEMNRSPLYPSAASVKDKAKKLLRGRETWGGQVELDEKWQTATIQEEVEEEQSPRAAEASQPIADGMKDNAREIEGDSEAYEEEEPQKPKWKPWLRRYA